MKSSKVKPGDILVVTKSYINGTLAKEGEVIATVLIDHKEVKMFGGKPLK